MPHSAPDENNNISVRSRGFLFDVHNFIPEQSSIPNNNEIQKNFMLSRIKTGHFWTLKKFWKQQESNPGSCGLHSNTLPLCQGSFYIKWVWACSLTIACSPKWWHLKIFYSGQNKILLDQKDLFCPSNIIAGQNRKLKITDLICP